jgi:hypothetical protein
MTEIEVKFNTKDIRLFEKEYKAKALKKDKKTPSLLFLKYLEKDNSKHIRKTVVNLKKVDLENPNSIENVSYEQELTSNDFDIEIAKLIKKSKRVNISELEKKKVQNQITKLLEAKMDNSNSTMNTNIIANDISAQDKLLNTSENYIGFVYFFWSVDTMNFKIIGLHSINPLFEFVNVKQTFYLIKPAMITNDKPIYFCFDKIPYSIYFNIKDDMITLSKEFIENGTTSDIFYYMEKNKNYIRVYGFNKIPMRIWIMVLLIIGFIMMLEFLVLSTILRV